MPQMLHFFLPSLSSPSLRSRLTTFPASRHHCHPKKQLVKGPHRFEGVAHHWLLGWKLHRAITLAQKNARPREHIARGRSANNRSGSRSEVQHQSPRSQTSRCHLGASATSLGEGNKGHTPDPPQQDPTVILGRLQLHWERATKAVHQIPRSKTPQTASERGNVDNVNIIIIRLVTERVG